MSDKEATIVRIQLFCPTIVAANEITAAAVRTFEGFMSLALGLGGGGFEILYARACREAQGDVAHAVNQAADSVGVLADMVNSVPSTRETLRTDGRHWLSDIPAPVFDRLCRILGV